MIQVKILKFDIKRTAGKNSLWGRVFLSLTVAVLLASVGAFVACLPNSRGAHGQVVGKKGIGMTTKGDEWTNKLKKLNALHLNWHYSWGVQFIDKEPAGVEFVPMIWSGKGVQETVITRLEELAKTGKIHYLLGFNEPDQKKQSNMRVEDAIALWPQLMRVSVPLGSPACAHPMGDWMKEFMKKADSLGYRVDFVTVHYYGGTSVDNFISRLKQIHEQYGRPIWITEFAVADWKAKSVSENRYTQEEVLRFMKDVLPRLDSLPFVKRYAWFSANTRAAATGKSALFNPDGSLTALGKFYADYASK